MVKKSRATQVQVRRWSPTALLIAVTLLVLVLGSHVYQPDYVSSLGDRFIHSLHAPGFALISLVVLVALRLRGSRVSAYWKAAAITLALGVLSEIFQSFMSRDAELRDLISDATGIYCALALAAVLDPVTRKKSSPLLLSFLLISGVAALFLAFQDPVGTGRSIIKRYENLPVLLSFEESWESYLYDESEGDSSAIVSRPDGWPVTSGTSVLRATSIGRWETLLHLHPFPDWRKYEYFSFIAASPVDNEFRITVSIRVRSADPDAEQIRFSRAIDVTSEAKRYKFALAEIEAHSDNRPVDLAHVETVVISGTRRNVDVSLLLDDFRLE